MDTEALHEVPSHSIHSSVVRPLLADVQIDRRWRQLCHDAVKMSRSPLSLALFPPESWHNWSLFAVPVRKHDSQLHLPPG